MSYFIVQTVKTSVLSHCSEEYFNPIYLVTVSSIVPNLCTFISGHRRLSTVYIKDSEGNHYSLSLKSCFKNVKNEKRK